jgi:hypothetical protein
VCSFARTSDGSAAQHDGQIWFFDPRDETIELKLHFAYTPDDQDTDVDGPDNITVSAYGGVIIAEDGDGVNHLVGLTDSGQAFFFARNDDPENSEFAGPDVLARPKDPVRERPGAGLRVRDQRSVQEATSLTSEPARRARAGHGTSETSRAPATRGAPRCPCRDCRRRS